MKKVQIAVSLVILAAVIGVVVSFAGCSKSQGSVAGSSSQSSGFNLQNYKQQLDNSLSSLVQDGTITAGQEDKIIDAYASLMSSRSTLSGNRPSGASGSGGQWNGSRPSGYTGSRPSGVTGKRTSGMNAAFNPLSKLVTAKTITQAQADAVTKALAQSGAGFGGGYGRNRQSGQTQQS